MIAMLMRHKWLSVLALIVLFGVLFVFAAFLTTLGSAPGTGSLNWKSVGLVAAFFASLGALYGSVAALDERSGMSVGNHPFWRVVLGAGFGATTAFVVWSWNPSNFDVSWTTTGAVAGAILGWYGWRWARYVDF
jgi:hypothetical protein